MRHEMHLCSPHCALSLDSAIAVGPGRELESRGARQPPLSPDHTSQLINKLIKHCCPVPLRFGRGHGVMANQCHHRCRHCHRSVNHSYYLLSTCHLPGMALGTELEKPAPLLCTRHPDPLHFAGRIRSSERLILAQLRN